MQQTTKPSSGTIILYDRHENKLAARLYTSPRHRTELIENWRLIYGPKFSTMYYHISPITDARQLALISLTPVNT